MSSGSISPVFVRTAYPHSSNSNTVGACTAQAPNPSHLADSSRTFTGLLSWPGAHREDDVVVLRGCRDHLGQVGAGDELRGMLLDLGGDDRARFDLEGNPAEARLPRV